MHFSFDLQRFTLALLAILLGAASISEGASRAKRKPKAKGTIQFVYEVPAEWAAEWKRFRDYDAQSAWLRAHPEWNVFGWESELAADLNGDGVPERFVRVVEHSKFAGYSIFRQHGKGWQYLGSCDYGGMAPVLLAQRRGGWRSFSMDINGSRGRLVRRYFRFDPAERTYDLSYEVEIRPGEIEPEEGLTAPR